MMKRGTTALARTAYRDGFSCRTAVALMALVAGCGAAGADPGGPPEIRSSQANPVPACVTPERLMAFVATHNDQLPPKYAAIATAYRDLGEAWHIRWDYAFYQMVLETNYLRFKRGDGSSGDVGATQNNFAGIGATGGGVPGDRFPDVHTGVLAQMQHLVAYSGEHVERPVAQRTREFQNDIIEISRKLGRPVKFGDLSHRWAADRGYARNIETVADLFRKNHCTSLATTAASDVRPRPAPFVRPPNKLGAAPDDGAAKAAPPAERVATPSPLVRTIWRRGDPVPPAPRPAQPRHPATAAATPQPGTGAASRTKPAEVANVSQVPAPVAAVRPIRALPAQTTAQAPEQAAAPLGAARFALAAEGAVATGAIPPPERCRIFSASYGGSQAVLIRAKAGSEIQLTALTVEERSSRSMAESYLASHARGGEVLGSYESQDQALTAARRLCPAD